MKSPLVSTLAAAAGFALGFALPVFRNGSPASPPPEMPKVRERPWSANGTVPGSRMQAFADKAAELSRDEWPAFFRTHLVSPERARLAAKLWAEADPAGFWAWLRGDFDLLRFQEFAPDLVRIWAASAPDAAMDAVAAITDKRLGGELRKAVIDTVLDQDVTKGVELAARAGDFNSFGRGPREWMKKDPAAAVAALATLPPISDYRLFLTYAVPIWAESDPAAALKWMNDNRLVSTRPGAWEGDEWVKTGFEAAAKADPAAALDVALTIDDPRKKNQALAGLVTSGTLTPEAMIRVLEQMPPNQTRMLGGDMIAARPAETVEDLMASAKLLDLLPAERNNLHGVGSLAAKWKRVDPPSGWQWASSLTDPAARRRAVIELASTATPQQVADLPVSALSDGFFRNALSGRPSDQRSAWISQLPADRAAWARSAEP